MEPRAHGVRQQAAALGAVQEGHHLGLLGRTLEARQLPHDDGLGFREVGDVAPTAEMPVPRTWVKSMVPMVTTGVPRRIA